MSDVTFDIRHNRMEVHQNGADPWRVTVVDTGDQTMTGGRLRRVRHYLDNETFCLTYGDGVGNIDIERLVDYHRQQKTLATLTAVQPPGRFGAFTLEAEQKLIHHFKEKPRGGGEAAWVSGGFFVLEPAVMDYIASDSTVWEQEPLENLAKEEQLSAYRHYGFWQPVDTLRDKNVLEALWQSGEAPWKVWG
jgi:glucose-1-phosphate cytidylyltransferase